jgi:2-polyprenyl-3-methyl-5-hydroxy-6-metoxy-1,4-benzoquinol methylase
MRHPQTNEYIPAAWEKVNCPVCNSNAHTVYERFGHKMQYTYVKCKSCGLIYSSPRPRYDQDYIDSCYATYQFFEEASVADLGKIHTSSVHMFEKEVQQLVKFDKQRTNVLDIGSGMGTFLYAAKPFYKKLTGLDVSEKMAGFVRKEIGVDVLLQQFQDHESAEPYSLIHMSHVIEHIPNPNDWLKHAKKLLLPNGILVINVPNKLALSNLVQHYFYKLGLKKQFSSSWKDPTRTPDHLYEPTIPSFKRLIAQNGFKVLACYTYSRKDPVSDANFFTRLFHRTLRLGSNITFITTPAKMD